jgi:phenol hydroxylase P5 protein
MILDLLEHGCTLPMTLVYGQRSREELYHHDQFQALAAQHPNFTYVPVLSHEPEGSDWSGARGFVHGDLGAGVKQHGRSSDPLEQGAALLVGVCRREKLLGVDVTLV